LFALAREERQISPGDPPKKPDRSWTRPLSRAGAPLAALGDDDDDEGTIADPNMRAAPKEQTEFPVPDGWDPETTSQAEFDKRVREILKARDDGVGALEFALSAYEVESFTHFEWLRRRYEARRGGAQRR